MGYLLLFARFFRIVMQMPVREYKFYRNVCYIRSRTSQEVRGLKWRKGQDHGNIGRSHLARGEWIETATSYIVRIKCAPARVPPRAIDSRAASNVVSISCFVLMVFSSFTRCRCRAILPGLLFVMVGRLFALFWLNFAPRSRLASCKPLIFLPFCLTFSACRVTINWQGGRQACPPRVRRPSVSPWGRLLFCPALLAYLVIKSSKSRTCSAVQPCASRYSRSRCIALSDRLMPFFPSSLPVFIFLQFG